MLSRRFFDKTVDPNDPVKWKSFLFNLNLQLDDLVGAANAFNSLPVYANNAAAVAAGLKAGSPYRTGGNPDAVAVVH